MGVTLMKVKGVPRYVVTSHPKYNYECTDDGHAEALKKALELSPSLRKRYDEACAVQSLLRKLSDEGDADDEEHMPPENLMYAAWQDDTHWKDVAKYTGSTTGTTRDNTICSRYTPITWQVDRMCHKVSAKAWDQMCKKMKEQKDDMKDDTHAHGARAFAKKQMVANNQQSRK